MIPIENEYEELIIQIEELTQKIKEATDEDKIFIYKVTYDIFGYLYEINKKNIVISKEIDDNLELEELVDKKNLEISRELNKVFIENKEKLKEILIENISVLSKYLEEFFKSKFVDEIYEKDLLIKQKEEDIEIFRAFLKSESMEEETLFENLIKNRQIFKIINKDEIVTNGITIYNPLRNNSLLFIKDFIDNPNYLETMAHEMGHIYDTYILEKKIGAEETKINIITSKYREVISIMKAMKLYEFMIKNNINKELSIICLGDTLFSLLLAMEDALLICSLKEEDYLKLKEENVTRKELIEYVNKSRQKDLEIKEEIDEEVLDEVIDFEEVINYSYGVLLANLIINDKDMYEKFLKIRRGYSKISDLEKVGIKKENINKKLVKNLDRYFGEYI